MGKKKIRYVAAAVAVLVLLYVVFSFVRVRVDLTSEKRYSLSENTKGMMRKLDRPTHVVIYLDGDLNAGFLRLQKATTELLDEMAVYAGDDFDYELVNPSGNPNQKRREENYARMESRGLKATVVYEKDDEGKAIQKVVFPWAVVVYGKDSIPVSLLQNNPQLSGDENLNNSSENLEYVFMDALRVRLQKEVRKVAFLEGHGELPAEEVYDASLSLSKYFQVDRGVLMNDASVLDAYDAVIIAGPTREFSEGDKFILDQYIMNGGGVLWLLEGVRMASDSLSTTGVTPAIPLELNLGDMLFKYGVRMVPALLEDMQCVQIPMNVAQKGDAPKYEAMPFYYSPLLLASPESPITRNIVQVRGTFTSGVDLSVNGNRNVKKSILLVTSNATHVEPTPARIDLSRMYDMDSKTYFSQHYMPVAALLEGRFGSVYENRMLPDSVRMTRPFRKESKRTRMIVAADADLIRNEIQGTQASPQVVPMGYDRYTGREYGNRDFIVNSVLYLTDDSGWLDLRSREFRLRMLNKVEIIKHKTLFQVINVGLPLVLLMVFGVCFNVWRRRKYGK